MNTTAPSRAKRGPIIPEEIPELEGDEFAPAFRTLESDLGAESAYEHFSIGGHED